MITREEYEAYTEFKASHESHRAIAVRPHASFAVRVECLAFRGSPAEALEYAEAIRQAAELAKEWDGEGKNEEPNRSPA